MRGVSREERELTYRDYVKLWVLATVSGISLIVLSMASLGIRSHRPYGSQSGYLEQPLTGYSSLVLLIVLALIVFVKMKKRFAAMME